ncbi:hypothetical protein VNO77_33756 [Canavalia gladiata]|uniref:Uncharacterized protein n=1 Tax=Canavalia gladiata TaxID=3824 RepID=A0AAN9KGA6_CANGL
MFLLLAFTINFNFATANDVHDIGGNLIQTGGIYYILDGSYRGGNKGGVTAASIGPKQPHAVVQIPSTNSNNGNEVVIANLNDTKIINIDDFTRIQFGGQISGCKNPSDWVLVNDESAKLWYVGFTCDGEKPSNQIKKGRFQIKEYNANYKLSFCSESNLKSCDEVGIHVDGAKNKRLAIGSATSTFAVKFKEYHFKK